ncbi:MAG: VanW family protein [Herpetosiphonaceae bacterium]|nr:MAG: VanW family protein [Herpetosiphonaceae bacterium]
MIEQVFLSEPVDPYEQAIALTRSALAALRRGDRLAGERLLRAALRLDPSLGIAWLWLGALKQGARRSMCLRWARLTIPDAEIPTLGRLRRQRKPARQRALRSLRLTAGGLIAALLVLGGFELRYSDRIYPGVAALGRPLAGQTPEQAGAALEMLLAAWAEMPLVVRVGEASWSAPLGSLARFDAGALAGDAYNVGRSGPLVGRIAGHAQGILNPGRVTIIPVLEEAQVEKLIDDLAAIVDREARPARFVLDDTGLRILPEEHGLALDTIAAREMLYTTWERHHWSGDPAPLSVVLPVHRLAPELTQAELAPFLGQLRYQTAQSLELSWEAGRYELDRLPLLDLATLPEPGRPFRADRDAVAAALHMLASEIDRPAQPSRLVREGNNVREFIPGIPGRRLNVPAALELVMEALERGHRAVTLPIDRIEAPPGEAEALGLVAVIGEGRSQFVGYSSPNRDQNVLVGGSRFDGLLIPPGGVISADETIGPITWEQGYRWGDMIVGGQLVPALGGGICQVSTTFFRAAFWSGLEILERHNHQWRLPWYEVDAPPGMDATIALGGPDLKVRNNTGHYLLIKVTTDLEQKTQRFTIYGTPPGWRVEMLGPSYRDGAVVIGRRVLSGEQIILEDSFTSYYSQ